MKLNRRYFLKNISTYTTGIAVSSALVWEGCSEKQAQPVFPFFSYAGKYNIGEYMPKDQGGKFIQQQLIGSEKDEVIVEALRNGLLQKILGDPINWATLEKTELEKSVWLKSFLLSAFVCAFVLPDKRPALPGRYDEDRSSLDP